MAREDLSLWWAGESDNVFVLYLTGAISLSFVITVLITRSLRRKEPRITELLHEDSLKHMLITYLLCIFTSRRIGMSCPETVKVFMQVCGENGSSQFFHLKSQKGGRPIFKRGYFDIFLFKVPVSLGKIYGVKLILSGVDKSMSWKITGVQLYDPATRIIRDIQTTVVVTEVIGYGNATQKILALERPYADWFVNVCLYHQWLSIFVNTVHIGAYTETVQTVSMFATFYSLLLFTEMAYIILPSGAEEDQRDLQIPSLLKGSFIPAVIWTTLSFIFELLLRKTISCEKNPGNAYFTVIKENKFAKTLPSYKKKFEIDKEGETNIWTTYVIQETDLDGYTILGTDSDHFSDDLPHYLARLIHLIELEEDRLKEMMYEREELLHQRGSLLNLDKRSSTISMMSFVSCVQSASNLFQFEVYLPSLSALCIKRILSGKSLVKLVSDTGAEMEMEIGKLGFRTNSYLDAIRSKKERSQTRHNICNKGSTDALTIDITAKDLPFPFKSSVDQTQVKQDTRTDKTTHDHFLELPTTLTDSEQVKVSLNQPNNEHIIEIEDIKVEDTAASDIKIDMVDMEKGAGVRRRHLDKPVSQSQHNLVATEQIQNNDSDYHKETGHENSDLSMPEVQYIQQKMDKPTLRLLCEEWQTSEKEWCRMLIQTIHGAFKSCRHDILHGKIRTSELDMLLLEWSHEIVRRITASCTLRRVTFVEDMLEQDTMIRLYSHLSSEILMFAVRDVYQSLRSSVCVALADIILQSHHVMLGVEQAADCIAYLINKDSHEMCDKFRYLDMGQDLVDIRDQFLQMNFHLTVIHSDVTWAFFVNVDGLWRKITSIDDRPILLKDQEKAGLLLDRSLERLSEHVMSQLSLENMENVIIKKLCHAAENEAKHEVWEEYCSQEYLYLAILIRQQVIKKLTQMIKQNIQKKKHFDEKYDLMPVKPKTRLEKVVDKRRQRADKDDGKLKSPDKDENRGVSRDINKNEVMLVSKALERYTETLEYLREKLHKKWNREGMKGLVQGGKYLVQALLHPQINEQNKQTGKYRFKNYLHLKRCESFVRQFLEYVVFEVVGEAINGVVENNKLRTVQLDNKQKDLAAADILANVDTLTVVLSEDIQNMAHEIICQEASMTGLDLEMFLRKSSILINKNFSAIPKPANEGVESTSVKQKRTSKHKTAQSKGSIRGCYLSVPNTEYSKHLTGTSDADPPRISYKSKKLLEVEHCHNTKIDDTDDNVSLSDLIKELQPLKTYIEFLQTGESLRTQCTMAGYLERQKQKREYAHKVYINNMIDSYYLIPEGDDSHMFTKAGRYQLEHDLMGESFKPLPKCMKSFIMCVVLLLIVFSGIYVTIIGGQFTTTQAQEWICYFLLSLALFGFVFEPIRAVVLGYFLRKK